MVYKNKCGHHIQIIIRHKYQILFCGGAKWNGFSKFTREDNVKQCRGPSEVECDDNANSEWPLRRCSHTANATM